MERAGLSASALRQMLANENSKCQPIPAMKPFRDIEMMTSSGNHQRISHREILNDSIGYTGFVDFYRQRVLTQNTRTLRLLGRKSSAKIINTLLGYEVQAAYKRIHCPDMVTARYLKLFTELGCHSIKLPYDPTLTEELIPEFESMMQSIIQKVSELFPCNLSIQRYAIRKIYAVLRRQLRNA
jgi:hypothetical protein